MSDIELNKRQEEILEIVKNNGPITGEQIAERLSLTRATLRPDLAILTMAGFLDARPRVGYFQSIPIVVAEDMSVYDAICQMFLEDVGTLFVVDKNAYLTGVLSRKDLLRTSIGSQDLNHIPVHIIMTRMPNIAFCFKTDGLIQAANKLIERQIDALPVVVEHPDGYEVIGRITKTNITRAFLSLAENHDL